ncbi:MAG: dihydrolipoamide succinyltransferase, partial [Actinobacteria bacterium]|nr:dihydrolipoamide succinyltransferase [Actinomycetota bacterium]NIX19434.1 dihydrolipoamide succinyltransferase [Actinomycetota bacterium]
DPVRRDENLVDLETEKVVLEVPAPADGVLAKIVRQAGETVLAEEVIAILEPGTVAADPGAAAPEATAPEPPGVSPPLSPAVRRLVTEHGLDPSRIDGTGKDG